MLLCALLATTASNGFWELMLLLNNQFKRNNK